MGWIINSIANVFLETINDALKFFLRLFMTFQLDIGYSPKTASLGNGWSISNYIKGKGLFDSVFPGAEKFTELFMICGCLLVLIIMLFKIFQGLLSPLGSDTEHPVAIVGKSLISLFLVTWSYNIFIYFEKMMNLLYVGNGNVKGFQQVFAGILGTRKNVNNVFDLVNITGKASTLIAKDDTGLLKGIFFSILMVILWFAVLYEMTKLFIEVFERYVLLGVMFYTCPLAFATLSSESTKGIFKSWVQMVVSQFILMFMSSFFLAVFAGAMVKMFTVKAGTPIFQTDTQFITTMFVLIAWLVIGQKVDQHLKGLGLSTAQAGGGLAGAIFTGYATARTAMGLVNSGAKIGGGALAGASKVAGGAFAGTAVGQNLNEKLQNSRAGKAASAVKGKADQLAKGNSIVSNAERQNGKLTDKGMNSIWDGEGSKISGNDAKESMDKLGISTNNPNADWSKSTFGAGKATIKDSNGAILGEYADPSRYSTPSGIATKSIQANENSPLVSYAVGSSEISADTASMLNGISHQPAYENIGAWVDNGNGTAFGYSPSALDSSGNVLAGSSPTYVAAPDYIATPNPDNCAEIVSKTTSSGLGYSISQLNGNNNAESAEAFSSNVKIAGENSPGFIAKIKNGGGKRFR